MPERSKAAEQRISFRAIREMDELMWRFRCRLREVAMELSAKSSLPTLVTTRVIPEATRVVCSEILSNIGSGADDEGDAHGERDQAA